MDDIDISTKTITELINKGYNKAIASYFTSEEVAKF